MANIGGPSDNFVMVAPDRFMSPANLHSTRILLCDDSPIERLGLAHFLRLAGYQVDEASDGQSCLHHLKHRPVDLMLLDLQMPDVDGFDVLKYVQEHRPGLPVVLLSGMPLDQIQHKMQHLPQRELPPLFIKPVDVDQLMDMLELQLSGDMPKSPRHEQNPS